MGSEEGSREASDSWEIESSEQQESDEEQSPPPKSEHRDSSAKSTIVKFLERDLSAKEQLKRVVREGLNEEDSCGSDFDKQELDQFR